MKYELLAQKVWRILDLNGKRLSHYFYPAVNPEELRRREYTVGEARSVIEKAVAAIDWSRELIRGGDPEEGEPFSVVATIAIYNQKRRFYPWDEVKEEIVESMDMEFPCTVPQHTPPDAGQWIVEEIWDDAGTWAKQFTPSRGFADARSAIAEVVGLIRAHALSEDYWKNYAAGTGRRSEFDEHQEEIKVNFSIVRGYGIKYSRQNHAYVVHEKDIGVGPAVDDLHRYAGGWTVKSIGGYSPEELGIDAEKHFRDLSRPADAQEAAGIGARMVREVDWTKHGYSFEDLTKRFVKIPCVLASSFYPGQEFVGAYSYKLYKPSGAVNYEPSGVATPNFDLRENVQARLERVAVSGDAEVAEEEPEP